MKENTFECRSVQTRENLREMAARIMRPQLIIHAAALLGLSAAFVVYVLVSGRSAYLSFALILLFACIGIAIYRFQSVPGKYSDKTYSQSIKLRGTAGSGVITAGERSLSYLNEQTHVTHEYEYSELAAIYETEHLFVIKTRSKTYLMADKRGFSAGSPEKFGRLLREQLTAKKH